MPQYFTISQLADEYGVKPRYISDLFYGRILDNARCPVVGGRRLIPYDYAPEVRRVLTERGRIRQLETAAHG